MAAPRRVSGGGGVEGTPGVPGGNQRGGVWCVAKSTRWAADQRAEEALRGEAEGEAEGGEASDHMAPDRRESTGGEPMRI